MKLPVIALVFALAYPTLPSLAAGMVILELSSPQTGQNVSPGQRIDWVVRAHVSPEDNLGLAFLSFDLVQDPGNPRLLDLPVGDLAPAGMGRFDRPGGYANPGQDPWLSGYGGTPVGENGAMNLLQIGGAQNTFGVAGPCLGPRADICSGQEVEVREGIGQSPGGQIVASGSFELPEGPGGLYSFYLASAVAGTLARVERPPAWSAVGPATVIDGNASLSFLMVGGDGGEGSTLPLGDTLPVIARPAVSLAAAPVVLPRDGATLNRTHVQFRWAPISGPAAVTTLSVVEDDGSENPFTGEIEMITYPVPGDEPRLVVTSGLEFSTSYAWQVVAETGRGISASPIHRFSIDPIPEDVPDFWTIRPEGAAPMAPGVTLFNIQSQLRPPPLAGPIALAVDAEGTIVYCLRQDDVSGTIGDIRLLENGRLLMIRNHAGIDPPVRGGFEDTLDGKEAWATPPERYQPHHEVFPMPDGHILFLVQDRRYLPQDNGLERIGDRLVLLDRHSKEELWSWSTYDHYALGDGHLYPPRWTHGNAAVYHEADQSIYYSSRHFNRITRIDYPSDQIIYNMGMNQPSGDTDFGHNFFSYQHAPQLLPNGNMMLFDNGNTREPFIEPRQSRALEIAFDHPHAPTEAWIVWEYRLYDDYGYPLFARALSDADRLPNGNTLVTAGTVNRIDEVDAEAQLVWKLQLDTYFPLHSIYRAERIPSLILDTPGDRDGDWDLDLIDLAGLQTAFTDHGPAPLVFPDTLSDHDRDADIDADDVRQFIYWMTGPL